MLSRAHIISGAAFQRRAKSLLLGPRGAGRVSVIRKASWKSGPGVGPGGMVKSAEVKGRWPIPGP